MSDGIYIGMSGAVARARQLESVADNLANAQTPGFKASRPTFASFLPAEASADGTRVYAAAVGNGIDLRPGAVNHTGDPLHILPEGDALLAVRKPDGSTAYTRDGRVQVAGDGTLTVAGLPLLDAGGSPLVIPPETRPVIDGDGTVRAHGAEGTRDLEIGRIALARVEGGLERQGASLLVPAEGALVVDLPDGRVQVGAIELANASPLEATVEMIAAHRSYDHSLQAIQTYRKLDERITELGRAR